tara:strand:+ start:3749 stop:4330 length:582 start_codon:yes stop_codon:yes gene_type:complete
MKKFIFLLLLVSSNIFCFSQTCDQININVNLINIYEVELSTNYDSLVNLNPNAAAVSAIYDWRAYPPGNHNWSGNSHVWQSALAEPHYSVTINDNNLFFILSLSMGDTATSPNPVNICLLPFFIARDTISSSQWNLTMLGNGATNILNLESNTKKLINTYNLAGQIVDPNKINQEIVIYKYSDGSTQKKFINR